MMRWRWRNQGDRFAESPVRPLYKKGELESDIAELRRMLVDDSSPETRAALQSDLGRGIEAFRDAWFQRIDFPGHCLTSTSDHRWAHLDEGGLNTLGARLTGEEASILRPWPKWTYLRRILPDLRGKSVLEMGSANGFFPFRFAELGAQAVTGVEANARLHESAVWAAEARGCRNVRFVHGDALLDLTLPRHDVVFLSEAWNHFLSPAFGLLRILAFARETVVLDTGIHDTPDQSLHLKIEWRKDGRGVAYHTYVMSEGLLMDMLGLMGILPAGVVRYKTPRDRYHAVYVIDTRDLAESRLRIDYPEYLRTALDLRFTTGVS
jgi:SAM-dependent methyltransferase